MNEINLDDYPKEHHKVIVAALNWLEKEEPKWNLDTPMNKKEYIKNLLEHISND